MKCLVLYSDGLDSRLAVKIMQENKLQVYALYIKLPFSPDVEKTSREFCKKHKAKFLMLDATKRKLLKNYMKLLKKPCFPRGKGVNPCIDCKIFLFKQAKKIAKQKGIKMIVSGEVLGERPLSQMKKAFTQIEEKSKLKNKILRPLSAKVLKETTYEKNKSIDRENLYDIKGRKRKKQIALAKKFEIDYPQPSGGCLLCDICLKKRFQQILNRRLNQKEVKLTTIGRHFKINNKWIVIGRNEKENEIIEKLFPNKIIGPFTDAPTGIILDKEDKKTKEKIKELIEAYSKKGSLEQRKKFEKYIL